MIGVAFVRSEPRSLPASGSVAPYAYSAPSSATSPSQRAFCSSVAPTVIGSVPRKVASTLVATPRSIPAITSHTR